MIAPATNGIVIGEVSSLEDPMKLGRIRVTFPHLGDQVSDWARLVSLMAGGERGAFFRPEIGDEVLVAFEHGDPRRAYILGSVWSKADPPPKDDGDAKKNNWRFIRSRSGHLLKLDDTKGKEKIEIQGKSKKHTIVIEDADDKIRITCDSGDIEIKAASGNVKVEAKNVQATAQKIEVVGQQQLSVKAPMIEMKADSTMKIDGGGLLEIKGGLVKIN